MLIRFNSNEGNFIQKHIYYITTTETTFACFMSCPQILSFFFFGTFTMPNYNCLLLNNFSH